MFDTFNTHIKNARSASKSKDWPEAVERWNSILTNHGDNAPAEVYYELARAHLALGARSDAESVIKTGVERHPDADLLKTIGPKPDDIAEQLVGRSAGARLVEQIQRGRNNKGIYVYECDSNHDSDNNLSLKRFVAKNTLNNKEYHINHCILKRKYIHETQDISDDLVSMFPDIYGIASGPLGHTLYMEYLGDMRSPQSLPLDLASKIVEAMWQINEFWGCISMEISSAYRDRIRSNKWSDKTIRSWWMDNLNVLLISEEIEDHKFSSLKDMVKIIEKWPNIVGHNDMSWSNLAVKKEDEGGYIVKFIDLEAIGANIVGADLQYFALISLKGEEEAAFFDFMSEEYARMYSQPVARVRAAAYLNGLAKELIRQRKRIHDPTKRKARRAIMEDVICLYEMADREFVKLKAYS